VTLQISRSSLLDSLSKAFDIIQGCPTLSQRLPCFLVAKLIDLKMKWSCLYGICGNFIHACTFCSAVDRLSKFNWAPETVFLKLLRSSGINSASPCPLAGWYDNPIPTRFLAPIDCSKIPAQLYTSNDSPHPRFVSFSLIYRLYCSRMVSRKRRHLFVTS
jgi:hypothetical protein